MLLDQFSGIIAADAAGDPAGSVQQHQQHGRFLALLRRLMLLDRFSSIRNYLSLTMLLLSPVRENSSISSMQQREQIKTGRIASGRA